MEATKHIPVLFQETIETLTPKKGETVIDATLGGGSHALAMLDRILPDGKLIAFDMDESAIERFLVRLEGDQKYHASYEKGDLMVVHSNYSNLEGELDRIGIDCVDVILADLGFSSDQIGSSERGLSFLNDGPLDMRLDMSEDLTAADVVNRYAEERLANILYEYGDESKSRRIAKRIVLEREKKPFRTTIELARCIENAFSPEERRKMGVHPATKSFQALRMEVNHERERLEEFLSQAVSRLRTDGRIGIISFHSGEDRIVKEFFRSEAKGCICPPEFPECRCEQKAHLKILTSKPIVANEEELKRNPRARSAKLRVAKKL